MTDFLYPFIEGEEHDLDALLDDLATSAAEKAQASASLRADTLAASASEIDAAAEAIAAQLAAGGRLFTFGNGGSSTDAATFATLFASPPTGRALPARALIDDSAVLTALGNDVGFSLIFSRQLIAHARPGDVAVGFSTSGNSDDLLMAFTEAAKRRVLTIGFAGYDGGDMGRAGLDHCLVVSSDSVHRIQETQAAVAYAVWRGVQDRLQEALARG
ncbi:MAG: D-sedoheptulose-7-phosphate isomerase [Acidimicrobiales bacterium]